MLRQQRAFLPSAPNVGRCRPHRIRATAAVAPNVLLPAGGHSLKMRPYSNAPFPSHLDAATSRAMHSTVSPSGRRLLSIEVQSSRTPSTMLHSQNAEGKGHPGKMGIEQVQGCTKQAATDTSSTVITAPDQNYIDNGIQRMNSEDLVGISHFRASAQMRGPHPTPIFTEPNVPEQALVITGNELKDYASGEQTKPQDSELNPSRKSHDAPQTDKESADNMTAENQPPPSSKDIMQASPGSDSEHISDKEQDVSESENSTESNEGEVREEHAHLSYQIPENLLREAMQASPKTRASYWSQRLYRGPNDELLSIHYCRSMEVAERVAKYFVKEKVLGFDIEWKPFSPESSIKENASLIQLACEDRIALFHIALYKGKTAAEIIPPTLKTILESPDIYKVGVAIKGDFTRLEKYLGIKAQGVFELSRLHNIVQDPSKAKRSLVGLSRQVLQHLQLPLYKGEPLADDPRPLEEKQRDSVRESDWSQPLKMDQIQYAAADAYAGFRLYDALEAKRKMLKPTPPRPEVCDYDYKPPEKDKDKESNTARPKTKRVQKAKEEAHPVTTGAAEALDKDIEASTQEYETAHEELMDKYELEESESESSSEASGQSDDPDGDYVPPTHRGRIATRHGQQGNTAEPQVRTRRIGRMDLSSLGGADPGYPTLPYIPADQEGGSDSSNAFDPLPKASLRRLSPKNTAPDQRRTSEEDEFADPELEEALMAMDIDKKSNEEAIKESSTTQAPQYEAGEYQAPLTEMDVDSSSTSTAPKGNGKRKNEGKDKSLEPSPQDLQDSPSTPSFKPLVIDATSHTPEYLLATEWAQSHLKRTIPSPNSTAPSRIRATVPHLRAYHLWHHQCLSLDDIARNLRDPPLAQSTVSNYILQAISLEKLEYRDEELRTVLRSLPYGLRMGRWKYMCERVGVR